MCFKGNCDVTNEAERMSMVRVWKEKGWGCVYVCEGGGCGGGRLEGDVAMETHRGASEAVAVGGDDSTLAPCK